MRLSQFIEEHIEPILVEWEAFARTMKPPELTLSAVALRDHAEQILRAIVKDMDSAQTEVQRDVKSKGLARPLDAKETAAAAHGAMHQLAGFGLGQLGAEYRALRATILRLWKDRIGVVDAAVLEEISRFNEGVDQALSESIASYSAKIAESRDTFLAVLGHDLRSPLGAFSNCLQVLQKTDGPASSRQRVVQIATRSIKSMDGLITGLREYTRTRLGRGIEVVSKPGDFGALCREAFEEVRAAYPGRELVSEISGDLTATFDAPRMRQVLINLLSNAVQHGDRGIPVWFTVHAEGEQISAIVKNWGAPIARSSLEIIFNPLVRMTKGESEQAERPTSLGLGLFIAREIVMAHGGTIDVTSSADEGTAFKVRLNRS